MSPSGLYMDINLAAQVWDAPTNSYLFDQSVTTYRSLRPVINLKSDTPVIRGENTVWKVVE